MSFVRTIILGERLPGMRSCAANTTTGTCKCGWRAPEGTPDAGQATMDHLYGDLTGAARRFAYASWRD